ncbi:MAG: hypothetical protein WCJ30_23870 [Deltaproteobacteria bacterium]
MTKAARIEASEMGTTGVAAKRVRFRLAGYLFTYRKATGATRMRIEMWREDPVTGERYWITVAACAPTRSSAHAVALALLAWVRSCDIGPKKDARSQAVAESFAMLQQHLAFMNPGATGSVRGRVEPGSARVSGTAKSQLSLAPVSLATSRSANDDARVTRPGACGGTRVVAA